jgi:hypothetical protein
LTREHLATQRFAIRVSSADPLFASIGIVVLFVPASGPRHRRAR